MMTNNQRRVTWKVATRTYNAPEYWLAARASVYECDGLSPPKAYRAALLDWETQEDLARLAEPERPRTGDDDDDEP